MKVSKIFKARHRQYRSGQDDETKVRSGGTSKGTDLARWSAADLEAVAHALNTRPRKTLSRKTPAEAFNEQLLLLQQASVASTG